METKSRRRKERVLVHQNLSGVYLHCENLTQERIHVINLSELGIGVETAEFYFRPKVGAEFEASLIVGFVTLPVVVKLAHLTENIAGFEFIDSNENIRKIIRDYFEPELVASSLKNVSNSTHTLIYEDEQSNKIEIRLSTELKIKKWIISILGTTLTWSPGKEIIFMQNEMIGPLPDLLKEQAIRLIQSSQIISSQYRHEIESTLERDLTSST